MVVNSIKVFARLKKEKEASEKLYEISKGSLDELCFYTSAYHRYGETSRFRFHKVFDQDVSQSEVFLNVAKPVVNCVLQGFNGTIFAYGQTGSGKTYSITGSPKTYQNRGIIPRSIQDIFSNIEKVEDKPVIYVSYMEIYNEICYDLLNVKEGKTAARLDELPRVVVLEDKKGEPRLRNLSIIPVSTEEEAMRLLFLGDTNRTIAETPMNEYSSRSHCIFTIYLTFRGKGAKARFSKLNLVDLAGSERVHKSQISGTILNEAKHINLSLHFLQQVILALSESRRVHIPYRNSVMTFILKDSLAGNCVTVMLSTLATTLDNIQETLSSCKFAQRVSMIKTEPVINEVHDPQQEIDMLRSEIQDLRKQLAEQKETTTFKLKIIDDIYYELSDIEKMKCEEIVEQFLYSEEKIINLEPKVSQIQYCFNLLKKKLTTNLSTPSQQFNQHSSDTKKNFEENFNKSDVAEYDSIAKENEYYTAELTKTYEKAKLFANGIEECQKNILFIRKKLDRAHVKDFHRKILLTKELEYQQSIYKQNIAELKEIKNETMHLQSKLEKVKALESQREQQTLRNKYSGLKCRSHIEHDGIRDKAILNTCCNNYQDYKNTKGFSQENDDFMPYYKLNNKCDTHVNSNSEKSKKMIFQPENKHIYKIHFNESCTCALSNNLQKVDSDICACQDCYPKSYYLKSKNDHSSLQSFGTHTSLENEGNIQTNCECVDCVQKTNYVAKEPFNPKIRHFCATSNAFIGCNSRQKQIPEKIPKEDNISIGLKDKTRNTHYYASENHNSLGNVKQSGSKFITDERFCRDVEEGYINFNVYSSPYNKLENYLQNQQSCSQLELYTNDNCKEKLKTLNPIHSNITPIIDEFQSQSNKLAFSDCVISKNNQFIENDINNLEPQSLFKMTDSQDFIQFMKTIPLTGDINIDQEICEFYRDKFC